MRINSPMLGTVDFSMIPAFFIDAATLLHGASSIGVTGGALGGAVVLGTRPSAQRGWQTQYVQGVGSFSTFDQYLRVSYGGQRWSASTRAVYSTSDNDFRYTNYDKMELVYGPDGAWSTPTTPSSATAAATSATCTCCRNSTTIAATARATAFRRGISARNAGCPSSRPTTATT